VQLTIESRVLERCCDLPRDCREQAGILAAERFAGILSSDSQNGDGPFRRDTRYEVVQTCVTPELDLLDGETTYGCWVVERDDVTF